MKNAATIISSIALLGVLILFGMHLSGNKTMSSDKTSSSKNNVTGSFNIAYVDIDSFESNYGYLKSQREKFTKRQEAMQAELQRSAQQLQNMAQTADQKARAGNMSQAEAEATQKKLGQMQQSLQLREQSLTEQLLKEKDEFNNTLHKNLDDFLKEYNKNKKYDYILSYSSIGSQILFVNPDLNITDDVIKGMNERSINKSDTTNKK